MEEGGGEIGILTKLGLRGHRHAVVLKYLKEFGLRFRTGSSERPASTRVTTVMVTAGG